MLNCVLSVKRRPLTSDLWPLLCSSASLARAASARACAFSSSASHEELAPDHVSLETADSGRGSWTSCSSNSHDNFQNLPPPPRGGAWELAAYRHAPLGGAIAEVEAGPAAWPDDGSERDQSRQSWASSSSLSDTYEGNYGTIKRRAAENAAVAAETPDSPSADPAYKTITSSTEKGLIGEPPPLSRNSPPAL